MFEKDLKPWLHKIDGLDRMRDNMYREAFLYEQAMLQHCRQQTEKSKCQPRRQERIELQTAHEILQHRTQHPAELRIAIEDLVEFEEAQSDIERRLNSRKQELEHLKEQQRGQNKWRPADVNIPEPKMDWRTTRKLRELQTQRNKLLNHMEEERRRVNPRGHPKRLY